MFELNKADKQMINIVVDSYHVSTPNKVIIREFYDRMKLYKNRCPKNLRKAVYQYAIQHHKDNQDLYSFVMN